MFQQSDMDHLISKSKMEERSVLLVMSKSKSNHEDSALHGKLKISTVLKVNEDIMVKKAYHQKYQ